MKQERVSQYVNPCLNIAWLVREKLRPYYPVSEVTKGKVPLARVKTMYPVPVDKIQELKDELLCNGILLHCKTTKEFFSWDCQTATPGFDDLNEIVVIH